MNEKADLNKSVAFQSFCRVVIEKKIIGKVSISNLALTQCESDSNDFIPTGFTKGKFTTLVWDNNVFGEEIISGRNTSHVKYEVYDDEWNHNSADE